MSEYGPAQLKAAREAMPDYLRNVHGITNLKNPIRCLSPDHEDGTPSMSYWTKDNRLHCFGCGAVYDAIDLAGIDTGAESFKDKVAAAADGAGIDLGEPSSTYRPAKRAAPRKPARSKPQPVEGKNVLDAVQGAFTALYEEPGAVALAHLHRRGFADDEICRNGWGWARHPREIFPTGFEGAPECSDGYICLPFPESEGWGAVRYAAFRECRSGAKPKERKRANTPSPVWREHLLRGGFEAVYIAEGVYDAAALSILMDAPACAMCGDNVGRVLNVAADTHPSVRPRYVIATDGDEAGRRFADRLAKGFAEIGAAHSMLPDYPDGAKDAADVLRAKRVKL